MISSLFASAASRRAAAAPAEPAETRWAFSDEAANAESPGEALRQRLQANRPDLAVAGPMVALLDPAQAWARVISQGLAPACRERANTVDLRNLVGLLPGSRIERVAVALGADPRVKIYAAEGRHTAQRTDLGLALAERSHLALVLMSTMPESALLGWLRQLHEAVDSPFWACPRLVFVLPAGADDRLLARQTWPAGLTVEIRHLPVAAGPEAGLTLWLLLQEIWRGLRGAPPVLPATVPPVSSVASVMPVAPAPTARLPVLQEPLPAAPAPLDAQAWPDSLQALASLAGVRGVALVDLEFGVLLGPQAREVRTGPAPGGETLELTANAMAAAAGLLRWRLGGASPQELLLSRADEVLLLQPSACRPRLGIVLQLEPAADLALIRGAVRAFDREAVVARLLAGTAVG